MLTLQQKVYGGEPFLQLSLSVQIRHRIRVSGLLVYFSDDGNQWGLLADHWGLSHNQWS